MKIDTKCIIVVESIDKKKDNVLLAYNKNIPGLYCEFTVYKGDNVFYLGCGRNITYYLIEITDPTVLSYLNSDRFPKPFIGVKETVAEKEFVLMKIAARRKLPAGLSDGCSGFPRHKSGGPGPSASLDRARPGACHGPSGERGPSWKSDYTSESL